jgi:superfamily I DNA and/or RNA helicase
MVPYLKYFKHVMSVDVGSTHRVDPRRSLVRQRRMHPAIGDFVGEVYYDSALEHAPETTRPHGVGLSTLLDNRALVWLDTSSMPSAYERNLTNLCEVQLLRFLIEDKLGEFPPHEPGIQPVCVLTPYAKQLEQLRRTIRLGGQEADAFRTVDSFQGREAEVVFVSLVRNNTYEAPGPAIGFLQDPERANVMFSRARRLLVIVGSLAHFARFPGTHWGRVVKFFEKHPQLVVDPSGPELGFRWTERPQNRGRDW